MLKTKFTIAERCGKYLHDISAFSRVWLSGWEQSFGWNVNGCRGMFERNGHVFCGEWRLQENDFKDFPRTTKFEVLHKFTAWHSTSFTNAPQPKNQKLNQSSNFLLSINHNYLHLIVFSLVVQYFSSVSSFLCVLISAFILKI